MHGHIIKHRHDPEADAVYITLSEQPYSFGEDLGPERRIDYAADGTPIGVELLAVEVGSGSVEFEERVLQPDA